MSVWIYTCSLFAYYRRTHFQCVAHATALRKKWKKLGTRTKEHISKRCWLSTIQGKCKLHLNKHTTCRRILLVNSGNSGCDPLFLILKKLDWEIFRYKDRKLKSFEYAWFVILFCIRIILYQNFMVFQCASWMPERSLNDLILLLVYVVIS